MHSIPAHELTRQVLNCAAIVHRHLGTGLCQGLYEACLCHELRMNGFRFAHRPRLPVLYKGRTLVGHCRPGIIVEDMLLLDIKSLDEVEMIHVARLVTWLHLAELPWALLVNFNTMRLRNGIICLHRDAKP